MLAAGHAEGADGLGLVHLAVADEAPDPAAAGVDEPAQVEVAVDVGLVDGGDGPEPHRHGRELPEVGQRARVRVAGQPVAAHLVAEVVELLLGQAALDEGPGVDAGRRVALEEDLVAEAAVGLAAEEVVEADLVERGRAGVGREVPADALGARVGPRHHDGGVPADVGPDAPLLVLVAGEPRLGVGRDGVDVGRRDGGREVDLLGARPLQELHEQVARPGPAAGVDDGVERVEPLLRLARIGVGDLVADPVEQHHPTVPAGRGPPRPPVAGVTHLCHATRERPDRRVHRRRVPGESRPGRVGLGRARRALRQRRRGPHHQPAHGDHGGARGAAVPHARRARRRSRW